MGLFSSIGKALSGVGKAVGGLFSSPVGQIAANFIPGLGAVSNVANIAGAIGGLTGGGGGGGSNVAGNLGGMLGMGQLLTNGAMLGQQAPKAPVWELDPGAKALMNQLTDRFQADLAAPGGMTALDNLQLDRLRHDTFGKALGSDAQRLYEQQYMRGIEGSHPAFQQHEALTRDADNRYWDNELALRQAARQRQFDLKDMAMGLTGLGNAGASGRYDSAYDAWRLQNDNWQSNQQNWSQLAGNLLANF